MTENTISKRRNQDVGKQGELEVIQLVSCPNCGKPLAELLPGFPLYDIRCTGCVFQAQVKTINSKPKGSIQGATWNIMESALKTGQLVPRLIVNFKWEEDGAEHQKIIFYPFLSKKDHLKKYFTEIKNPARSLWMFRYVNLDKAVSSVLYEK
ncbi:MAG TPA: hypothetical protein VIR98_02955 [Candidatus Paceibacterota bacterium]